MFIYYLFNSFKSKLRTYKHTFNILLTHKDNKKILYNSLKDLIPLKYIDKIYNDLFVNNYYTLTKDKLIRCLLGFNNCNSVNITSIIYLSIFNYNKLEEIKNSVSVKLKKYEYSDDIKQRLKRFQNKIDFNEVIKSYDKIIDNFNKLEQEYINMNILNYYISKIVFDLIQVLQVEFKNNKTKTLITSNGLIGYENKEKTSKETGMKSGINSGKETSKETRLRQYIMIKSGKETVKETRIKSTSNSKIIKTNKYLSLKPYLSNYSYTSEFKSSKIFYLNNLKNKIKIINDTYLIFDYDIDESILNWSRFQSYKNAHSYGALRLYRLNNKLFNEIVDKYKELNKNDKFYIYNQKYKNDKITYDSIQQSWRCLDRNINIKENYKELIELSIQKQKQYKIMYRGERRYE